MSDQVSILKICDNCNNQEYLKFDIKNQNVVCNNCGIKNKIKFDNKSERNKNKIIHLNNVIKNLENINDIHLDGIHRKLLKTIECESIKDELINSTYIYEFLKHMGIKKYSNSIWLMTKYHNTSLNLNSKTKNKIKLVFNEFINYLLQNSKMFKSISYHLILYQIYKYIEPNVLCDISPSMTRNNNETLIKLFDNFLNELCEKEDIEEENILKKDLNISMNSIQKNLFYQPEMFT